MLVALVLVAAVGTLTVAVRVIGRRRADELHTVQRYHDRLSTLHVAAQDRGGSVKVVEGQPVPGAVHEPGRPRLDPSAANLDLTPAPLPAARPRRHGRDWALGRMQPRARIDTVTVVIIAVVVAVLVAIGVVGWAIHRGHPPTTTRTGHAIAPAPTVVVAASGLDATHLSGAARTSP